MANVVLLLFLSCFKLNSVNSQRDNKMNLRELTANKFTYTPFNNQSMFKTGIRTRKTQLNAAANRSKPSGSLRRNNDDSQYKSCAVDQLSCDLNFKYRSFNGSCNNLENPTWGMVNTTYLRILPANYKKGSTYLPRDSSDGQPLPSARLLSSIFFPDIDDEDRGASLVSMQWGQFIAHDLAFDAGIANFNKTDCCSQPVRNNSGICLPIEIPSNDSFYARFNVTCQNMARNEFILSPNCTGIAEQFNTVSHFLDGSQIYGSDSNVATKIREFKSGRLLTQTCSDGKEFLPSMDSTRSCRDKADGMQFLAADIRANQSPQLTILHTLFVREHNRLVGKLEQLHPDWTDEILYQEARSIVIAELQHINYNEWLPVILGKQLMNKYKLYSDPNRNFTYDKNLKPVTINSFASTAFRAGHSSIQGKVRTFSNYSTCPGRSFSFSNLINHADIILQPHMFDEFSRGLTKQPMQKVNNFNTEQITQQLLHAEKPFGVDLLSTDIQRGRDHGTPSYIAFLRFCSGFKIQHFTDLERFIPIKYVRQLQEYYTSVDDVDLFLGGILEKPNPGVRMGSTFGCIIAEQFNRYKYGDRFWYEIRGQQHSFTNRQVHEIKKTTLSRIICDNSNNILNIAPKSFLQPSQRNSIVPCNSLPSINTNAWK